MCGASCGIIITTRDGKITNIQGDTAYPPTKGFICAKGRAFPELIYHKDRVTKPLKRVGLLTTTRCGEPAVNAKVSLVSVPWTVSSLPSTASKFAIRSPIAGLPPPLNTTWIRSWKLRGHTICS